MELLFIGLVAGKVVTYFIFTHFSLKLKREKASSQSVVLMDKIRNVCKFIAVE